MWGGGGFTCKNQRKYTYSRRSLKNSQSETWFLFFFKKVSCEHEREKKPKYWPNEK